MASSFIPVQATACLGLSLREMALVPPLAFKQTGRGQPPVRAATPRDPPAGGTDSLPSPDSRRFSSVPRLACLCTLATSTRPIHERRFIAGSCPRCCDSCIPTPKTPTTPARSPAKSLRAQPSTPRRSGGLEGNLRMGPLSVIRVGTPPHKPPPSRNLCWAGQGRARSRTRSSPPLGASVVEVGGCTPLPQEGNPETPGLPGPRSRGHDQPLWPQLAGRMPWPPA